MNAQHTQTSVEYGTPKKWIAKVAGALGGIDLDPCCGEAFAGHAHTRFDVNGLAQPWHDRVFVNPPGDAANWWRKLCREMLEIRVTSGVWLAYSIEQIPASWSWTDGLYPMSAFAIAYPHEYRGRIRYEARACDLAEKWRAKKTQLLSASEDFAYAAKQEEKYAAMPPLSLVPQPQPTHASAFVGLGISWRRWLDVFSPVAECTRGKYIL